jgi:hypothetical protein
VASIKYLLLQKKTLANLNSAVREGLVGSEVFEHGVIMEGYNLRLLFILNILSIAIPIN